MNIVRLSMLHRTCIYHIVCTSLTNKPFNFIKFFFICIYVYEYIWFLMCCTVHICLFPWNISCLCVWHEDKSLLWLVNKQKLNDETKVNNISKRQNTSQNHISNTLKYNFHFMHIHIPILIPRNEGRFYWNLFSISGKDQCRTPDSPESVQVMDPKSPISPQHHNSLAPPRSNRNGSSSPIVNGNCFLHRKRVTIPINGIN